MYALFRIFTLQRYKTMKKTKVIMTASNGMHWEMGEPGLVDGYVMDNGVLKVVVILEDKIHLCIASDLTVL